ncbi:MAG TPA: hypothetical protein DCQ32_03230 [Cyanobacteria bacterium UBA8156]|jgi:hypothetical protein|nr:hypothetical protein [Cyanobacteria bacterium UBA8156]
MSVTPQGHLPPEAESLRATVEAKLPEILQSFNQVLAEQYGLTGVRVGQFTLLPDSPSGQNVACDEESCTVAA